MLISLKKTDYKGSPNQFKNKKYVKKKKKTEE